MSSCTAAQDEDLTLVQRAQSGDLDAFDVLVLKHQKEVTAILYRVAPARSDLEDLVQETFVRAWRGLGKWQPEKPWVHWLKRVAMSAALDFCRQRQRSPIAKTLDESEQALDQMAAESVADVSSDAADEVQFLLSHLKGEDRVLLTLLYLNEMPISEIAAQLGWSQANTKIKVFRARQRLRSVLTKNGYHTE